MIIQKQLFTDNECNEIISFKNWAGGFHKNNHGANNDDVKYHAYEIPINNKTIFLYKKLFSFFEEVTNKKLYKYPFEMYLQKYEIGDKFIKHQDILDDRVFSIGIQLSDTNEYTGGDYLIYPTIDKNLDTIKIGRNKGNAYTFGVDNVHEITPITNGERWSVVSFIHNSELKKNLII